MRSNYRSERKTVMRTTSISAVKRTITTLEFRIDECKRFYHWPALFDSWLEDITMLRARLKDLQSRKLVE